MKKFNVSQGTVKTKKKWIALNYSNWDHILVAVKKKIVSISRKVSTVQAKLIPMDYKCESRPILAPGIIMKVPCSLETHRLCKICGFFASIADLGSLPPHYPVPSTVFIASLQHFYGEDHLRYQTRLFFQYIL